MWNSIIANINLIKLNIVELKKFIKIKIKKPHLLPIRRTVITDTENRTTNK